MASSSSRFGALVAVPRIRGSHPWGCGLHGIRIGECREERRVEYRRGSRRGTGELDRGVGAPGPGDAWEDWERERPTGEIGGGRIRDRGP